MIGLRRQRLPRSERQKEQLPQGNFAQAATRSP